jgi:Uma2 family endonuclease
MTIDSIPTTAALSPNEPTWAIAELFPVQGHWSVEAYFTLDTKWLVEFTDGVIEVLHTADEVPPPPQLVATHPDVTWEIAYLFPHQGHWRIGDYMALRPNRQVEFTDGFIEVLPMPKYSHQKILRYLLRLLEAFVFGRQLGEVMFAPLRVRMHLNAYREPDIVFMKTENLGRCGEDHWDGADLVMEIVSPDDRSYERDWDEKRRDYAAARIPEYWVIDPQQELITVFTLADTDATYQIHGEFRRGAQATSVLLAGFAVEVSAVLDAAKL